MRTTFDVIKMVEKSSKYHRPKTKDMKRASRRGRVEPRRREPKNMRRRTNNRSSDVDKRNAASAYRRDVEASARTDGNGSDGEVDGGSVDTTGACRCSNRGDKGDDGAVLVRSTGGNGDAARMKVDGGDSGGDEDTAHEQRWR